jgi:hypothetical protein
VFFEDIFLKIEDCDLAGGVVVLYAGSYYILVNLV